MRGAKLAARIAEASLAAMASPLAGEVVWNRPTRKQRKLAKRMPSPPDAEIQAWNDAVEAKKEAKKGEV